MTAISGVFFLARVQSARCCVLTMGLSNEKKLSAAQFYSALLSMCALILIDATAWAQTYPSKPIRVLDGFPAGGSTDIVARIIAPKFQESQGHTWIVDNRAGAQGIIAGEL